MIQSRRLTGERCASLRDAATFITKLPKAEHDAAECQARNGGALLLVERGGDPMLARCGVMVTLNRHVGRRSPTLR